MNDIATTAGGEAVVLQLPSHKQEYYKAMNEAKRKYNGRILFYFPDDQVLREIK